MKDTSWCQGHPGGCVLVDVVVHHTWVGYSGIFDDVYWLCIDCAELYDKKVKEMPPEFLNRTIRYFWRTAEAEVARR